MAVLACWVGVIGAWRMRQPVQSLHYIGLPAAWGALFLTIAVFVQTGPGQAAWKMLMILLVLFGISSVLSHATARAFRSRELGHWQPRDGDPMEFVRDTGERPR